MAFIHIKEVLIMTNEQVEKIAELFHEYVFGDNTDYENLEYYLEELGIEIYYAEMDDADGYLRINSLSNNPRIVIKANQYAPRQRFTIAHELGHLIWHYKFLPWKKKEWLNKFNNDEILSVTMYRGSNYSPNEKEKEQEANAFAGAFLMPFSKIKTMIEEYMNMNDRKLKKSELIDLIVQEFKVSRPAATVRVNHLLGS